MDGAVTEDGEKEHQTSNFKLRPDVSQELRQTGMRDVPLTVPFHQFAHNRGNVIRMDFARFWVAQALQPAAWSIQLIPLENLSDRLEQEKIYI